VTVDIENKRATVKIRALSQLTGNYIESNVLNLLGYDQLELGFQFEVNPLAPSAPPTSKCVVKLQFSNDGETFFDYAIGLDTPPAGIPATEIRTTLFTREFEFYGASTGTGNIGAFIWYAIPTAARFVKALAKEEDNGGFFGNLEIIARASDV